MTSDRKKMLLVDGSNQFFRAYSAQQDLQGPDGFPTGALHGFFQILQHIEKVVQPDYLVVVFDKGKSFRSDMFPEYKAQRKSKGADFKMQLEQIESLCVATGYPVYMRDDGFEADDIIGTFAKRYQEEIDILIFSADKDFAQLVNAQVVLLQAQKNSSEFATIDRQAVWDNYKIYPENIVEYLSIVGDAADNVPGISGIGPSGASSLLNEYGSWDNLYAKASGIKGKRGQSILESKEVVERAIQLITIRTDVDLDFDNVWHVDACRRAPIQNDILYKMTVRFGLKALGKSCNVQPPHVPSFEMVTICEDKSQWKEFVASVRTAAASSDVCVIQPVFSNVDTTNRHMLGIGICFSSEHLFVVLVSEHGIANENLSVLESEPIFHNDLFGYLESLPNLEDTPVLPNTQANPNALTIQTVWEYIYVNLVQDISPREIYAYDVKQLYSFAFANGLLSAGLSRLQDIMLLDYLDARYINHRDHSLSDIARRLASYEIQDNVYDTSSDPKKITEILVEHCRSIIAVHKQFELSTPMREILEKLEKPCLPILATMENNGIMVDVANFAKFSAEIDLQLQAIDAMISEEVGESINLRSPKQVGRLLYEIKKLKPPKKFKPSTDSATLQALMDEYDEPILAKILEYREIHKIRSTYLETLPNYVRADGRIHTQLHQTGTATGRLSSSEPNLQNIPIRKSWGKIIRKCFVAPPNRLLISADYSQVEMRILAHYCQEPALMESFRKGEDIHTRTAMEIVGDPALYTPEMRQVAKAINYGLIYGMSAFRLAKDLSMPQAQAEEYIAQYFQRYPQVVAYLQQSIVDAQQHGMSHTLLGRQRPIAFLDHPDTIKREAAERIALNAPIQGTAADIMKLAMIAIDKKLSHEFPSAKLLLQIHDELVIESDTSDAPAIAKILKDELENAYTLSVPLEVTVSVGDSWGDIH